MDLIKETQPHIDCELFLKLWLDLDEILEIEFFCHAIIRICRKGYVPFNFCYFQYEMVSDYILKYSKMDDFKDELFNDFKDIMEKNKYITKYDLYNEDEWTNNENRKITWLLLKAKNLLSDIPYRYSSILPL
jgi:hypothetical protein